VLKKKRDDNNTDVIPEVSLKYPPGFTPNEDVDASVEAPDILEAVGNSGRILCVWDPNMFQNMNETVSDYFTMVRGVWVPSGKRLNKESSNSRKRNLKAELADLELVIDKREGADVDVKRRQEVVSLLQEVEKRGRLAIRGVLVNGIWMESPSLVKNEFFDHFKNRFEQPLQNRIQLERDFLNRITTDQNEDLEREVSKEEIKRAVWDYGIDKAPGLDGFTFGFYRRYWNLIESDVVNDVKWFFQQRTIPKGGSSSFIMLIPKVPNANMVIDFRPIILIGSLYKIIAKILVNRLVMVLGDLVNEIQSAFMADRLILDGPFILNELVQWCKKKKKQAMIFKVDFEKAYDSVRWDFVDDILKKFRFGEKWCLFKGIKVASSLYISHLFYVDDAIFMGQWNQSNIDTITRVLEVFHRASGLRINMNKTPWLWVCAGEGGRDDGESWVSLRAAGNSGRWASSGPPLVTFKKLQL
nr:RNA-directed DNA polymerase, eukaryota, reverse transcriptase zinc-binding domain protein [Tanacetum cinerariifolium]